jgi:hypothetical protein
MYAYIRLFVIAFAVFVLPAQAADHFVPGIDDLPLMPGLVAVTNESTVFDAPGGRIVDAWAEGSVSRDAVRSFYSTTLPQLGWRAGEPDLFRREGETLKLEFPATRPSGRAATGGRLLVRFYLAPG